MDSGVHPKTNSIRFWVVVFVLFMLVIHGAIVEMRLAKLTQNCTSDSRIRNEGVMWTGGSISLK